VNGDQLDQVLGGACIEFAASEARVDERAEPDAGKVPGPAGRDVAKQISAQRPDMKVLFTSGYTPDLIEGHGVLETGLHFLQKPFTMSILVEKIREVLNGTIAYR